MRFSNNLRSLQWHCTPERPQYPHNRGLHQSFKYRPICFFGSYTYHDIAHRIQDSFHFTLIYHSFQAIVQPYYYPGSRIRCSVFICTPPGLHQHICSSECIIKHAFHPDHLLCACIADCSSRKHPYDPSNICESLTQKQGMAPMALVARSVLQCPAIPSIVVTVRVVCIKSSLV